VKVTTFILQEDEFAILCVKISLKGLREAELEDWKDGRKTRVMAVDSGMLAYTDFTHGDWPVVLVTWPPRYYRVGFFAGLNLLFIIISK
jgi:hypothetical protein